MRVPVPVMRGLASAIVFGLRFLDNQARPLSPSAPPPQALRGRLDRALGGSRHFVFHRHQAAGPILRSRKPPRFAPSTAPPGRWPGQSRPIACMAPRLANASITLAGQGQKARFVNRPGAGAGEDFADNPFPD